jgi:hypothetical protein
VSFSGPLLIDAGSVMLTFPLMMVPDAVLAGMIR